MTTDNLFLAAFHAGAAAERERCAAECDGWGTGVADQIAEAIRHEADERLLRAAFDAWDTHFKTEETARGILDLLSRARAIIVDYRSHYGTDHRNQEWARNQDERAAEWLRDARE